MIEFLSILTTKQCSYAVDTQCLTVELIQYLRLFGIAIMILKKGFRKLAIVA